MHYSSKKDALDQGDGAASRDSISSDEVKQTD
jgi:hypothetical protein